MPAWVGKPAWRCSTSWPAPCASGAQPDKETLHISVVSGAAVLRLRLISTMAAPTDRPAGKRVLLMGTCLCDAFYDEAARATVEVLEHLGVDVLFPENQTCCGQPAFNSGDWDASRKVARHCA